MTNMTQEYHTPDSLRWQEGRRRVEAACSQKRVLAWRSNPECAWTHTHTHSHTHKHTVLTVRNLSRFVSPTIHMLVACYAECINLGVCVFMYVSVYVFVCLYVFVLCLCMCVCVFCVCMYVFLYVCVCVCVCVCVPFRCKELRNIDR